MKHSWLAVIILAMLASCTSEDPVSQPVGDDKVVESFPVTLSRQKAAPGIDMSEENADSLIIIDGFNNGDLLYFSQLSPSVAPNFTDQAETASPYLYIYEYEENPNANWYEGYNFIVKEGKQALDWDVVKSVGSVGNAFSLYGMYFPVDNTVKFNVLTNQKGPAENPYDPSNFMTSDIMGAYHATSALFTRMRFRLFHLMVYLRVTLYVPVYEDEVNDDYTQAQYSGFLAGAVKGAFVRNANTDFSIEWYANRSSDTEAPLTKTGTTKSDIIMYAHEPDEDAIIDDLYVKSFYTQGDINYDRVREYNFSVLFPAQTFGDDFLCFALQAPDGKMKYYYFSGSQIVGESGNFSLTQGTLQRLYLYIPRKTNETILVGAKILPWKDAQTDMTVTKKTE